MSSPSPHAFFTALRHSTQLGRVWRWDEAGVIICPKQIWRSSYHRGMSICHGSHVCPEHRWRNHPGQIHWLPSLTLCSFCFQACMAGIVFAKFMMPMSRGETIMFSKVSGPVLPISKHKVLRMLWLRCATVRSTSWSGLPISAWNTSLSAMSMVTSSWRFTPWTLQIFYTIVFVNLGCNRGGRRDSKPFE